MCERVATFSHCAAEISTGQSDRSQVQRSRQISSGANCPRPGACMNIQRLPPDQSAPIEPLGVERRARSTG